MFRKPYVPKLSGLLPSRLSRSARNVIQSDSALNALSRLRKTITQTEVAAMCGTAPAVVASWEKGRRKLGGTAGILVRVLEGILRDWPDYWPGANDWRVKLWEFPVANIIALRLGAERNVAIEECEDGNETSPPA
ncbi:MAG: helix-turn-helix domain-containing protein [Verrucomicrobia bacterium]|nr:helix-turn-helix domain-containing protein [Verrucomicrobiota bacterium]